MKITITGGAGFLGSKLGYYFCKLGHNVVLIDDLSSGSKQNLTKNGETFGTFVEMNICDTKIEKVLTDTDFLFHFAGISPLPGCQMDPYNALRINVAGTANIIEAARRNKIKKISVASTSAVYEKNVTFPTKETDTVNPQLIYSLGKFQLEQLCQSYIDNYNMNIIIRSVKSIHFLLTKT